MPRLIRTFRDAEEASAEWLRWLGFSDAQCTPPGADGGVDVVGTALLAQVKFEGKPSGRPALQRLKGAAHGNETLAFFALQGYSRDALTYGDQVGMALFSFNYQGEPEPKNKIAIRWLEQRLDSADPNLADLIPAQPTGLHDFDDLEDVLEEERENEDEDEDEGAYVVCPSLSALPAFYVM